jgi:hypothetical protein
VPPEDPLAALEPALDDPVEPVPDEPVAPELADDPVPPDELPPDELSPLAAPPEAPPLMEPLLPEDAEASSVPSWWTEPAVVEPHPAVERIRGSNARTPAVLIGLMVCSFSAALQAGATPAREGSALAFREESSDDVSWHLSAGAEAPDLVMLNAQAPWIDHRIVSPLDRMKRRRANRPVARNELTA